MNKLEPFTRYDCEQDCSGYELGRAYMSECEIGDYVLYADAQAREAALVEALRLFVEEWDDLMMNQLASCYEYADALPPSTTRRREAQSEDNRFKSLHLCPDANRGPRVPRGVLE